MVNGIKHCHAHNVTHRDLKPENIVFDKDFSLKLANFGLADPSNKEMLQHYEGRKEYLAVEVLNAKPSTHKVDIFSLGIILFEMYYGYHPFNNEPANISKCYTELQENPKKFWAAH